MDQGGDFCLLPLQEFSTFFQHLPEPKRLIGYSKFAKSSYCAPGLYRPGDWLMFGAETSGLPQQVRDSMQQQPECNHAASTGALSMIASAVLGRPLMRSMSMSAFPWWSGMCAP